MSFLPQNYQKIVVKPFYIIKYEGKVLTKEKSIGGRFCSICNVISLYEHRNHIRRTIKMH